MRLADQLRGVLYETGHGLTLKLAAFGARALLLVMVLPNLLSGELAEYMFFTTVALLAARIVLAGVDLELPLSIRGDRNNARELSAGILFGWLCTALAGILFLYRGDLVSATLLLTFSLASNQFLGGTVRTLSPQSFERLINIPMLIFTAAAIFFGADTAIALLVVRALAGLVVQFGVAIHQRVLSRPSRQNIARLGAKLKLSLKSGWRKLLSNLSLRGALRGFILWPKAMQSVALSDSIAFAVAVGDVVYQLGMVFSNRRYAVLANQDKVAAGDIRSTAQAGFLLSILIIVPGIAVIYVADYFGLLPALTSASMLTQAVIFYSIMCLFSLMQFIAWTLRAHDWVAIFSQLGLLVLQGIICWLLPLEAWFSAAATGALVITAILGSLSLRIANE